MAKATPTTLGKDLRLQLLRTMVESRHGDLREESLNRQGKGHFHVSGRGHEALSALGAQLRDGDYIACYYRGRGLCLGRGMTTRHMALEYFAKRESASRGRMMPSHFSCRPLSILSVPTPLGSQLLPACGIAWGMKLDRKDNIVVTCIGDAATRQGDFYEAVSFALERKLPVLFVVEDNAYGISTPTRKTNPLAIGVLNKEQWQVIDGSDAEVVHAECQKAIARLRAGEGPCFIWARMERLSSHTSSDDHTLYRSKEDLAALDKSDPVRILREKMIAAGEFTAEEFKALDEATKEKVRKDYAEAEKAENPRPEELFRDVTGPGPELKADLFKPGNYRMGDLLNLTLRAGLEADPRRMIFGEDVEDPKGGVFRLTQKLSTDFPRQVFNSPLAESTIFGVGGGLALYGRRPVFELQFIDFSFPGFNQLVSNLANMRWRSDGAWKVPAVFYAPYGAYLPGGSLWHSQANESAFAHFPGLNIVIPSTPEDAAGLLWTAMQGEDVTLFLAPKHMLWADRETLAPVRPIPFGQARVCTHGDEVTIVAWGNTMEKAYEAIAQLGGKTSVELIDLRSIAPWDKTAIENSVRKTGRLVVVQEDTEACSVGQMIIQHISGQADIFAAMKAPPVLVTKGNVMIGYNPIYEYSALPDVARIVKAVQQSVSVNLMRGATPPSAGVAAAASTAPASTAPAEPQARPNTVVAGTREILVRVPVMGEGLRSARVVNLNKNPGEEVKQDDVLCELETDKAVYPVEASFAGQFKEWRINLDDTVLIGQEIAVVVGDAASVADLPVEEESPVGSPASSAPIPATIPPGPVALTGVQRPPALQSSITKRLAGVVSANLELDAKFGSVRAAREAAKKAMGDKAPSPSSMMTWCVTRAMEKHASFRCLVAPEGTILEQSEFDLGIAVALEGDRLATAVIPRANKLAWADFVVVYEREVEATRQGKVIEVQAPVNITSLGAYGVEKAWPIVVPPAMATLFIGTAHERMIGSGPAAKASEVVTLSLTFDHRVVNGAGVASFMKDVQAEIEGFRLPSRP
jgi:2-oxoisovalerate dehydrogenase E1 component